MSVFSSHPPMYPDQSVAGETRRNDRGVAVLFFFFGVVYTLIGVGAMAEGNHASSGISDEYFPLIVIAMLAFGIAQLVIGSGLWKSAEWARIAASVICAIFLLAFPVGTIINVVLLRALWKKPVY